MDKAEKILVLGIDGMDPRLSKYHMEQGYMPNLKEFLKRGSSREDLVLLSTSDDNPADVDYLGYRCLSCDSWDYRFLAARSK